LFLMAGAAAAVARPGEGEALIQFEDRLSDCPFVERVWRCRSLRGGRFTSVAAGHFEMALTRLRGKTFLTLRGPELMSSAAECPAEGEWVGIRFKIGTFMPQRPPGSLQNRNDLTLPDASSRAFWLNGSAWEYPDFENADAFVRRLVTRGLIVRDAAVDPVLRGEGGELSLRSGQRHFLRATGMTFSTYRQIERARYAAGLLKEGDSILDAVELAGYFDQAHLTRSVKRLIGMTPSRIRQGENQLSFLYKTEFSR
jgi:hypothetical protein